MSATWDEGGPGVLTFPSGRRVRGRSLRRPVEGPDPELGVYLAATQPPEPPWPVRWITWRDFWLPRFPDQAAATLREAWEAAADCRVEIGCGGGVGRTGTALACLAVLDGVPSAEAVGFVRARYVARAVETPWQRRFVERFAG